ncbi:uncharacterized protein SAPINGB_P004943 [Magnusiomyces paraingens]|uniref:Mitochondrial presequence protease n=1 Tax=Magnusiomyces paraingens TaxID=2606893 RepID=A0A5E8BXD1_9ASCO|nr:uncharacterized protein SAPINGB_P004943 [Saprochaete ingens]VVT56299.1 unnamed protein product [Saprochaete ingens]
MSSSHPLKLIQDIKLTYSPSRVFVWRSERTGLQSVLIQQSSTMVRGHFAVGSEIHNDSGCPHTLEHLVFMGSKKYPYKGLLDILGNKMMSETNAWTAVDQTVYTISTVGWEAFSVLLPVYIDHIINPTITDSACTTEVYYLDGNGEDRGVVFSEMQGIENTASSIEELETQKLLFGSKSAFSSETGGLMAALRVLSHDQIRQFHKDIYRPDNLSIIVSGDIDPKEFAAVVQAIDDSMPALDKSHPHPRPFVDTEPSSYPSKKVVKTVEFPETDETFGEISISWIGPKVHETIESTAIDIILKYLTLEGIGILCKEIVDIPDPLATDVYFDETYYLNQQINISLSNVATENLQLVFEKAEAIIAKVVTDEKYFDLKHVQELVERTKYKDIKASELSSSELVDTTIVAFLYGSLDGKSLRQWIIDVKDYDVLLEWTAEQWKAVVKKYLVDNPLVAVLAKPSKVLSKSIKKETANRIAANKEKYGPDGLAALQAKADAAQAENNKPVPESVLKQFKAPDLTKIKFIDTTMAKAGTALKDEEQFPSKVQTIVSKNTPKEDHFPLYVTFEDYESQFVTLNIYLSTREVDTELLPYVQVFFTELFTLPILLEDGVTHLSLEDTIRQLKSDTLKASASLGSGSNGFEDLFCVSIQARADKYADAVKWAHRALSLTQFTDDRISVLLDKHINRLAEYKRYGSYALNSSVETTMHTPRSMRYASDLLITEERFKKLQEDHIPGEVIRKDLEKIRSQLVAPHNMRIFISGQVSNLKDPVKTLEKFLDVSSAKKDVAPLTAVPSDSDTCAYKGKDIAKLAKITSMPSTESSYATVVCPGINGFKHEDLPALYTAVEYLNAVEGPIWRGVRGAGYAYGANISALPEVGHIHLQVYRGADTPKAVQTCKKLVSDFVTGETPLESLHLEGAKNMVAHNFASSRQNSSSAALLSYIDYTFKGLVRNNPQEVLKKVAHEVTAEKVREVMEKYFLPLFDPKTSMVFVACHSSMTDDVLKKFEADGYEVSVKTLATSTSLAPYGSDQSGSEDEDKEEEEDEEESDEE